MKFWDPEGPPGHEISFSGGRNEILMSHSECHLIGGDGEIIPHIGPEFLGDVHVKNSAAEGGRYVDPLEIRPPTPLAPLGQP